MPLPAPSIP
jgi:hypothetical protein